MLAVAGLAVVGVLAVLVARPGHRCASTSSGPSPGCRPARCSPRCSWPGCRSACARGRGRAPAQVQLLLALLARRLLLQRLRALRALPEPELPAGHGLRDAGRWRSCSRGCTSASSRGVLPLGASSVRLVGTAWIALLVVVLPGAPRSTTRAQETGVVRGPHGTIRATPADASAYQQAVDVVLREDAPLRADPARAADDVALRPHRAPGRRCDELSLLPGALATPADERAAIRTLDDARRAPGHHGHGRRWRATAAAPSASATTGCSAPGCAATSPASPRSAARTPPGTNEPSTSGSGGRSDCTHEDRRDRGGGLHRLAPDASACSRRGARSWASTTSRTARRATWRRFATAPGFRFVELDCRDALRVRRTFAGCDAIVHLAAEKIPRYGNALKTLQANVAGAKSVYEAALALDAPVTIASTSDVYGNATPPFAEDDALTLGPPTTRRWAYATSKLYDEHVALALAAEQGLRPKILRLLRLLRPAQPPELVGRPAGGLLRGPARRRAHGHPRRRPAGPHVHVRRRHGRRRRPRAATATRPRARS